MNNNIRNNICIAIKLELKKKRFTLKVEVNLGVWNYFSGLDGSQESG